MSRRGSYLHRDEEIVLDLHPHWVVLAKGVLLLVAAVALGVWILFFLDLGGVLGAVVRITVSVLIILSLLYLLQRWAAWVTTNFVVTTDRCIYREGILTKRGIEIPHDRINTVFFHQGVLDRVMRAGTLTIESAGENGMQTFEDVKDPVGVQQVIYQQIEDNESRRFDHGRAGPHSVADELAKLATLRNAGHLSDDEFARQKARLLDPPTSS